MDAPKVVIDTCVIESAIRSRLGASFQILEAISEQKFRFGVSVALALEYEYRLRRLSGVFISKPQTEAILDAILHFAEPTPIYYSIRPNLRDENDNHVYECCINFGATKLITHNAKDFLNADLMPYSTVIVSPGTFIKELR